jgi:hypothetical protein
MGSGTHLCRPDRELLGDRPVAGSSPSRWPLGSITPNGPPATIGGPAEEIDAFQFTVRLAGDRPIVAISAPRAHRLWMCVHR